MFCYTPDTTLPLRGLLVGTIADRLRQAMLRAGYTINTAGMRKLAERVDCSWQNIQGILAGRSGRTQRAGVLYPLSRVLGVRYDWLIKGERPMLDTESEIKRLEGQASSKLSADMLTAALSQMLAIQQGDAYELIVTRDYIGADRRRSGRRGTRASNMK